MNEKYSSQHWLSPPEPLSLPQNTVDVWRGIVDCPKGSLRDFWDILSKDEQERALRYKFPIHRDRYIAARGILRRILGRYITQGPQTFLFSLGPHGKPFLNKNNSASCKFNVAHSGDLALYAISYDLEVGIDVETHRDTIDYQSMISRILTEQEASQLWALSQEDRQAAFFSCWTKKEAYLKARGNGLIFPMKQIAVGVATKQPSSLLEVHGDPGEATRWSLKELLPGPGYSAAVVASGSEWHLRCWDYST